MKYYDLLTFSSAFVFSPLLYRFTQRELKEGKSHITELTDKWLNDINRRDSPLLLSDSEAEEFNQDQA